MRRRVIMKITYCPTCGSCEIKLVVRNWHGKFKDVEYTVPRLPHYSCPKCGEKVFDRNAMSKIREYSPAYRNTRVYRKSA